MGFSSRDYEKPQARNKAWRGANVCRIGKHLQTAVRHSMFLITQKGKHSQASLAGCIRITARSVAPLIQSATKLFTTLCLRIFAGRER